MSKTERRILVTGGAGFIGSHLVEHMVRMGYEVVILDDLSTGKRENLGDVLEEKNCRFIEGSILDFGLLSHLMKKFGFTHVSHQAARPSVARSIEKPLLTTEVNVQGTVNVLKMAVDGKCKKVVLASSSSVYGDSDVLPKHEGMHYNPKSPYAASKVAGELYLRAFHLTYNLNGVALRYFNVFGRRQDPTSQYSAVIPKFIRAALKNEPLYVDGDGFQTRDFTYIEDVVTANLLALEAKRAYGEVINIACSERVSVLDLAKRIVDLTESQSSIQFRSSRPGDVRHSLADITRAQELLSYKPAYNLDSGLKESVVWYKKMKSI